MSINKKKLTLNVLVMLLLSVSYVSGFDSQIVDNQEGMTINLNTEPPKNSLPTDYSWYYNTIGSFALLFIVGVSGVYAYKTIIKNEKVNLNGTYKKTKPTKTNNYV